MPTNSGSYWLDFAWHLGYGRIETRREERIVVRREMLVLDGMLEKLLSLILLTAEKEESLWVLRETPHQYV